MALEAQRALRDVPSSPATARSQVSPYQSISAAAAAAAARHSPVSSPHVNVGASSGAVAPSSPLTSLPVVDGKGAQHPNPFVAHDDGDVITDPSFGSDDDEACSASATKRPRPSSAPVDHPDEVEQNGADHGVASEEEQGASRKRQRLDGSVDAHPDGENGDWDGILARMGSDGWESDSKLMLVSEKPSESNGEQISAETTEGSAANGGNEDGQMQLDTQKSKSPESIIHRPQEQPNGDARPSESKSTSPQAANGTIMGQSEAADGSLGSALPNPPITALDLKPEVSGTELSRSLRDEYLSLLRRTELVTLVKDLEQQLVALTSAQQTSDASTTAENGAGASSEARVYPRDLSQRIGELRARRLTDAVLNETPRISPAIVSQIGGGGLSLTSTGRTPSGGTAAVSFNDVYTSLMGGELGKLGADVDVDVPALSGDSMPSPVFAPSRPSGSSDTPKTSPPAPPTAAANTTVANLDMPLSSLLSTSPRLQSAISGSSNAMSNPTLASLLPSLSSTTKSTAPTSVNVHGPTSVPSPSVTLSSVLSAGPMPSNASLAAAIAAHFGGNIPKPTSYAAPQRSVSAAAPVSTPAPAPVQLPAPPPPAPPVSQPPPTTTPASSGPDLQARIASILGSLGNSAAASAPMLGPQGLPLAPARGAPTSAASSSQSSLAALLANIPGFNASGGPMGSTPALANLFSNLNPPKPTAQASRPPQPPPARQNVQSPAPTGANPFPTTQANPILAPGQHAPKGWGPGRGQVVTSSPARGEAEGESGTSALPSYEDMIVEGLLAIGDPNGTPPRMLFHWMEDTYPLMKNFRPSASQALQKAFKRGRLDKTGSLYRINPNWDGSNASRKPTRRPQVGKDHPMVTAGPNGQVISASPYKAKAEEQGAAAYRQSATEPSAAKPKPIPKAAPPARQPATRPGTNQPHNTLPFSSGPLGTIQHNAQQAAAAAMLLAHTQQQQTRPGQTKAQSEAISTLAQQLRQTASNGTPATAQVQNTLSTLLAGASARPPPQANNNASSAAGPQPAPTLMQQLARMLQSLNVPLDPALASTLVGQLGNLGTRTANPAALAPLVTAAAATASANNSRQGTPQPTGPSSPAPPSGLSQPPITASQISQQQRAAASAAVASEKSAAEQAGATNQADLDAAVQATLAAALKQLNGGTDTASAAAAEPVAEGVKAEAAADKQPSSNAAAGSEAAKDGADGAGDGSAVNLADFSDALRALMAASGGGADEDDEEGEDDDEADEEADERAIAAAEADIDDEDQDEESEAEGDGEGGNRSTDSSTANEKGEGGANSTLSSIFAQFGVPMSGDLASLAAGLGQSQADSSSAEAPVATTSGASVSSADVPCSSSGPTPTPAPAAPSAARTATTVDGPSADAEKQETQSGAQVEEMQVDAPQTQPQPEPEASGSGATDGVQEPAAEPAQGSSSAPTGDDVAMSAPPTTNEGEGAGESEGARERECEGKDGTADAGAGVSADDPAIQAQIEALMASLTAANAESGEDGSDDEEESGDEDEGEGGGDGGGDGDGEGGDA